MSKRKKIRWAKGGDEECGHHWDAKPGETVEFSNDLREGSPTYGQAGVEPATGPHYCIKAFDHTSDPTNDDHQCCCGNTTEET